MVEIYSLAAKRPMLSSVETDLSGRSDENLGSRPGRYERAGDSREVCPDTPRISLRTEACQPVQSFACTPDHVARGGAAFALRRRSRLLHGLHIRANLNSRQGTLG